MAVFVAQILQLAFELSALLVGATVFGIIVSVPIQLWCIRRCLRDAPQPVWSELVRCLRTGAQAIGPIQALVIKATLPVGCRLWPPVSDDTDAVPPPARS